MSETTPQETGAPLARYLDRRKFLRNTAAVGAGLALTSKSAIAQEAGKLLQVALVGCGAQGERLRDALDSIKGVRIKALCDIWEFKRSAMARRLNAHRMPVDAEYANFEELLEKETGIDAVIIAVPDWLHHTFTRMALEKGVPVYCEKMMSNTIEGARDMVSVQKQTGGILQIGHQRHSNPRYIHLKENIVHGNKLLGIPQHCYAQWNRGFTEPTQMPKNVPAVPKIVAMYGSMERFLDWRWFRDFGGGPLSDLGAHQIDLFNWMFNAKPTAVLASGGLDYPPYKNHYEHIDNAMCIFEYDLPDGKMRAMYQVLTNNGSQSYYEKFMGDKATAIIAEDPSINQLYREGWVQEDWDTYCEGPKPLLLKDKVDGVVYNKIWEKPKPWTRPKKFMDPKSLVAIGSSKSPTQFELPISSDKKYHQPHLENFFEAIRLKDPSILNCPAQQAFECTVVVLKAKEVAEGNLGRYEFKPEDFAV